MSICCQLMLESEHCPLIDCRVGRSAPAYAVLSLASVSVYVTGAQLAAIRDVINICLASPEALRLRDSTERATRAPGAQDSEAAAESGSIPTKERLGAHAY